MSSLPPSLLTSFSFILLFVCVYSLIAPHDAWLFNQTKRKRTLSLSINLHFRNETKNWAIRASRLVCIENDMNWVKWSRGCSAHWVFTFIKEKERTRMYVVASLIYVGWMANTRTSHMYSFPFVCTLNAEFLCLYHIFRCFFILLLGRNTDRTAGAEMKQFYALF